MRMKFLLAACAGFILPAPARADSLVGGFPICASEKLLDQMYTAILDQDERGVDYLMGHGCLATKDGVTASILDRKTARALVRVYGHGATAEGWVSVGALASYQH